VSTFVSIGNALQPFGRLLDEVARLANAGLLPQPVVVQHGHTPFSSQACSGVAFLELRRFEAEVERARLCIIHAGAGSVLYALRAGKVPVIMPRDPAHGEIIDDHQQELAGMLDKASLAVIAKEPSELESAVRRAEAMQAERRDGASAAEPRLVGLVRDTLGAWDRERKQARVRVSAT